MTLWPLGVRRERASSWRPALAPLAAKSSFALLLLLLALLPLVGHGCHGDDIDHEPSAPPPVYNQE